jgi:hypothetical protein
MDYNLERGWWRHVGLGFLLRLPPLVVRAIWGTGKGTGSLGADP